MNGTFIEKSERIKAERKRLGLTQAQVAEKCGIRRQQWIRYEKGTSKFDGEPLRRFADLGASVGYILTGERSNVIPIGQIAVQKNKMSDDEKEMNELFSELAPEEKKAVLNMARLLVKQKGLCEYCFILFVTGLSWLCGGIANYLVTDNYWLSMPFGVAGIVLLGLSFILIERRRSRLCRS